MAGRKNTLNPIWHTTFIAGIIFFCLACSDIAFLFADENIQVKAVSKLNRNKIGIGERLIYTTTIFLGKGVEIDIPKAAGFGTFELKDSRMISEERLFGRRIKVLHELVSYETGKQIVPGLKINYRLGKGDWKQLQSNDVDVYVQSVFERSKIESDIRPIERPIGLKFRYTFHIITGIPLLFAAIYSLRFFIRYRKRILEKRRRGPARNILVYRQLSDKLAAPGVKTGFGAADFIVLSGIIREYLGLNLGMDSSRFTTEEFIHSIKQHKDFYPKYGEDLSFVLRTCDMVKFANHIPQTEEYKRIFSLAGAIKENILPNEVQE